MKSTFLSAWGQSGLPSLEVHGGLRAGAGAQGRFLCVGGATLPVNRRRVQKEVASLGLSLPQYPYSPVAITTSNPQNMNLGPGALSQSGSSQGLHPQGSLSDTVSTGLPPASLMQGQIGNGPNHVSMQQTAQSTLPTTSMSLSGSGHGTGPGYSHSGPTSQSVPMQGQGAISNYVSRTNINMQSNPVSMMHQQAATSHYNSAQGGSQHYQGQAPIAMMGQGGQGGSMMGQRPMAPYRPSQQGSSQQYLGQEEYYSEQYSHSQGSAEPMSQQYYPDGHGDYAYQQSSSTTSSSRRSFKS